MKKLPRYRFLAVLLCLVCVAPACASDESEGDASERADVGADVSNDSDASHLCDPLLVCPPVQDTPYREESDQDCPQSPPVIGTGCGSKQLDCFYCEEPQTAETSPRLDMPLVSCRLGVWTDSQISCTGTLP